MGHGGWHVILYYYIYREAGRYRISTTEWRDREAGSWREERGRDDSEIVPP
jgi:hypothetical protein